MCRCHKALLQSMFLCNKTIFLEMCCCSLCTYLAFSICLVSYLIIEAWAFQQNLYQSSLLFSLSWYFWAVIDTLPWLLKPTSSTKDTPTLARLHQICTGPVRTKPGPQSYMMKHDLLTQYQAWLRKILSQDGN